jgi:hypothetical protein
MEPSRDFGMEPFRFVPFGSQTEHILDWHVTKKWLGWCRGQVDFLFHYLKNIVLMAAQP